MRVNVDGRGTTQEVTWNSVSEGMVQGAHRVLVSQPLGAFVDFVRNVAGDDIERRREKFTNDTNVHTLENTNA